MSQPFAGVRILDFTQVFAGPFGSYQLAVMGADVIKVERPGGEDMRQAPPADEWGERGLSTHWMAINANKRCITLDLKRPEAVEVIRRLAERADVVMENFKAGSMDRLGIGYEALSAINPGLIYCAISGFGQNGPERGAAGYDGKIQALSGIMSITGHPDQGPMRAGFAVCDALAGMTAAFGVSSALFQRSHTGKGQFVDISMLDAALAFLSPNVVEWTVGGHKSHQFGNQAISRRPTANLFTCKGGHLLLAVNNEKQFQCLLTALDLQALAADPRFADWPLRVQNEAALRDAIEGRLAGEDAKTWEARLNAAGAPCAAIWSIDEIVEHPQLKHRDVLQTIDSPYGPLNLIASGVKLRHGGPRIERAPALLGADTDAVLAELGYTEEEIGALHEAEVV